MLAGEPTTFLSPPETIQDRILQYAGLLTGENVSIGLCHGDDVLFLDISGCGTDEWPVYHTLRLVNRKVKQVKTRLIAQSNQIHICPHTLGLLANHTMSLKLRIIIGRSCKHPGVLLLRPNLLADWRKVVESLRGSPFELALELNTELAKQMLDLMTGLSLRSCSIAVPKKSGLRHDIELPYQRNMPGAPQRTFPFMSLPQELQMLIMSFTSLAVPMSCDGRGLQTWGPGCGRDFCSSVVMLYPPCPCWQFPSSFFLVSRQFNTMAWDVLTQNTFTLQISHDYTTSDTKIWAPQLRTVVINCQRPIVDWSGGRWAASKPLPPPHLHRWPQRLIENVKHIVLTTDLLVDLEDKDLADVFLGVEAPNVTVELRSDRYDEEIDRTYG